MPETVEIASEKPAATWVYPLAIEETLDARFYHPEFLRVEERLLDAQERGLDVKPLGVIANVQYGFMPTEDYATESTGVPLIRVTNFTDTLSLDMSDVKYVRADQKALMTKSVAAGDILMVQCGNTTGKITIASKDVSGFLVASFCFRIRVKANLQSEYVAVALMSDLAQTQIRRTRNYTTVRPNTTKPATQQVKIPLPPQPVQEHIGAKVRLAERCRTRARELRQEAQRCLDVGVGIDVEAATQITEGRHFHALAVRPEIASVDPMLISRRLDPAAYSTVRLALLDLLDDARCEVLPIEAVADDVTKQRRRYKRDKYAASYFVSILHLNDKGVVNLHEAETHNPVSSGIVCQAEDILFSGINPSQNRVAVWTRGGRALCSAEFSIYRARKGFSPFYLAFVWRSGYCLNQMEALTRGTSSSRRRLKEEDFAELLVPGLVSDDQTLIARNEQRAVELDTRAAELVREAKADVEALIEGQLDVEGIIAGRVQPPRWEDLEV